MSTFQQVIVIGNLGSDPITKHFDGGGQLTQLSIATTEHWIDKQTNEKKESTEWHRVLLNGKLSELAEKYLKKGSKVLIEGRLKTRKYIDASNIERYVTEIVGDTMKFMSSNQNSENTGSAVDRYESQRQSQTQSQTQTESPANEEEHDDLPF